MVCNLDKLLNSFARVRVLFLTDGMFMSKFVELPFSFFKI